MNCTTEVSRDEVPRDRQVTNDVSASLDSQALSRTEDVASVTEDRRDLFERISDADHTPPRPAAAVVSSQDVSPSPVPLFQSAAQRTSVFDMVRSWPCTVPNNCSISPPPPAAPVTCQSLPAVPEPTFYAKLASPPPPPLEDLLTAGMMLPRVMTPLTIDTSNCLEVTRDDDAEVTERADDVSDVSCMTSDVNSSLGVATEQPPAGTCLDEAAVSPSPSKIPRLRIVMAACDVGQLTTSPGSASSLPYVVTVDDEEALALAADDDVTGQASPPRDDVVDDSSSSLVESGSRSQRKVKQGAAGKVRCVSIIFVFSCSLGSVRY